MRVHDGTRTAIGGVHSLSRDSLVLMLWEQPGSLALPLGSIRRLEFSSGRESRWNSAFRWGWRSALIFAGLTAFTVVPFCQDAAENECDGDGAFLVQSAFSGGLVGAVYGSFAPRERMGFRHHRSAPLRSGAVDYGGPFVRAGLGLTF